MWKQLFMKAKSSMWALHNVKKKKYYKVMGDLGMFMHKP